LEPVVHQSSKINVISEIPLTGFKLPLLLSLGAETHPGIDGKLFQEMASEEDTLLELSTLDLPLGPVRFQRSEHSLLEN